MENKIEISTNAISKRIYTLRGVQVMLDTDLAKIYEVETKRLKEAVRRNIKRFPSDFMFEPSREEFENLETSSESHTNVRSQIASIRLDAKFQPYMPFVFTESGITMLSCVLHSPRAIQVNIEIMRAFVQLRKQPKVQQLDWVPKFESVESEIKMLRQKFNQFETQSKDEKPHDPISKIQNIVARHWGLKVEDLKSATRTKAISLPRQIAIYLIRTQMQISFAEIGSHFGQRDHTSIMHAYRKIDAKRGTNKVTQEKLNFLNAEIQRHDQSVTELK